VSLNHGDVICLRPLGYLYSAAGRAVDSDITCDIQGFIKSEIGYKCVGYPASVMLVHYSRLGYSAVYSGRR